MCARRFATLDSIAKRLTDEWRERPSNDGGIHARAPGGTNRATTSCRIHATTTPWRRGPIFAAHGGWPSTPCPAYRKMASATLGKTRGQDIGQARVAMSDRPAEAGVPAVRTRRAVLNSGRRWAATTRSDASCR